MPRSNNKSSTGGSQKIDQLREDAKNITPKSSIQAKMDKIKQKKAKDAVLNAAKEMINDMPPPPTTSNKNRVSSRKSKTTSLEKQKELKPNKTTKSVKKEKNEKNNIKSNGNESEKKNKDKKSQKNKDGSNSNSSSSGSSATTIVKKENKKIVAKKKEETEDERKDRLSHDRSKRRLRQQKKAAEGTLGEQLPWDAPIEEQMKKYNRYGFLHGERQLMKEQLRSQKNRGRFAIPKTRFSELLKEIIQELPEFNGMGFQFRKEAVEALHEAVETEMVTLNHIANVFTMACASTEPVVKDKAGKTMKNGEGVTMRTQKFPPPGSTITVKLATMQAAAAILNGKLGTWGSRSFQNAHNFVDPRFDYDEEDEKSDDYMEVNEDVNVSEDEKEESEEEEFDDANGDDVEDDVSTHTPIESKKLVIKYDPKIKKEQPPAVEKIHVIEDTKVDDDDLHEYQLMDSMI